ncbi:hypothetical protein B0H14DRAFT_2651147 [Mycena olivaceomarginata]|nr:hypothetical protein B0H14DRAFT_2651147 [Mycena olivaceomarginata]
MLTWLVKLAFSLASAIILLKEPLKLASFSFTANHVGIVPSFQFHEANICVPRVGAILCTATDTPSVSDESLFRRILVLTASPGAICAGSTFLMVILLLKGSPRRVYVLTLLGNFLVGVPAQRATETTRASVWAKRTAQRRVPPMAVETNVSAAGPIKSGDKLRSSDHEEYAVLTYADQPRPPVGPVGGARTGTDAGKGKTDPERDYEE